MKKFTITLLIITVYLGIAHTAKAAMWPVALNQDSITANLSQDVAIQIVKTDYTGERLFVDFSQQGEKISVKMFPSSAKTEFFLISNNEAIIKANPQYTFKGQPVTQPVISKVAETISSAVSQSFTKLLFQDADLTVGADQAVTSLKVSKNLISYVNGEGGTQVSKAYDLSFSNSQSVPLKLNLRYTDNSSLHKVAYYFDYSKLSWIALPSYNDIDQSRVYFEINQARIRIAIFGDDDSFDGKASWYDQSRYKTFGYKNGLFAAHRTLPKGTKVEVTRLKTGIKTVVVINDWGPEEHTGRLIDLDKQAFQAIATTGAGEVYVNIRVIND